MKIKLDSQNFKNYEQRADILKAMAHPTRLFILETLQKAPSMCVCEINDLIEADVSTISKHLSILKNVGLLSSSKQGLQVYYKLETPGALKSLECIEAVLACKKASF